MGWFGIRGIGSLYYLLYAINHHIERALAQQLLSITLAVVVASVVAHGVSVTPLMKRYEARKAGDGALSCSKPSWLAPPLSAPGPLRRVCEQLSICHFSHSCEAWQK
jgi:hypothetical protein